MLIVLLLFVEAIGSSSMGQAVDGEPHRQSKQMRFRFLNLSHKG